VLLLAWRGQAAAYCCFTQLSGCNFHTCALTTTDSLAVCWGDDSELQSTPLPGQFASLAAGGYHTCALRADGTAECWRVDYRTQSTPPAGTFTQIAVGAEHTCGLRSDGTVECWGYEGETPTLSGTFVQIEAGSYHTCGIRPNGLAECWGDATAGPGADQRTPPAPDVYSVCGDGLTEGLETCDDGNTVDTYACTNACQNARCGDQIVGSAEQCDDGNLIDTDACTNTCQNASCGDSTVGSGEPCDDGNNDSGDGCTAACVREICGDGVVNNVSENCDDGNAISGDGCSATCATKCCGDGVVNNGAAEECDDGNTESNDGCSADCKADCAAQPLPDCRGASVSSLLVRDSSIDTKDIVKWKWVKGAATSVAELSDPTAGGTYNICLYPDVPGTGALSAQILLPAGPPWEVIGIKGYRYRDLSLAVDGVFYLQIIAGTDGRSKIVLTAFGTNLPDILMPATSYTVQLVDTRAGTCWGSVFTSGAKSATLFKARALN